MSKCIQGGFPKRSLTLWVLDIEQNYLLLCAIQKRGLHTFILLLCVHSLLNYFCFPPTRSDKKSIKIIPLGNFFLSFSFRFKLSEKFSTVYFDTGQSLFSKYKLLSFFLTSFELLFFFFLQFLLTTWVWFLCEVYNLWGLGMHLVVSKNKHIFPSPLLIVCPYLKSLCREMTTSSLVLYWNQRPDLIFLETLISFCFWSFFSEGNNLVFWFNDFKKIQ